MQAKILLVDDEPYIRELYAHILTGQGCTIVQADNGEDAYVKICSDEQYDLILLDIMLPKLTGMKILEKLKAEGKSDKIKQIILLTNVDEDKTLAEGVSYGIRGYLIKSQNPPEKLAEQIAALLTK